MRISEGSFVLSAISKMLLCLIAIHLSFAAKPISLAERCSCRSTVNNVPRSFIRELKFIHTPNCPFQVMWVLMLSFPIPIPKFETLSSLLDISHHQSPGGDNQIKEMHMYTHTPLSPAHIHKLFLQHVHWGIYRKRPIWGWVDLKRRKLKSALGKTKEWQN